jgi:hypothetical protein
MPRLKADVAVTQTTEVKTAVKLTPKARAMIKERCEERATIDEQIEALKERRGRADVEIQELFKKEGQIGALCDGCEVDGYPVKLVCGTSNSLDKLKLKKKFGLTDKDIKSCTESKPKKPYLRVGKDKSAVEGEE